MMGYDLIVAVIVVFAMIAALALVIGRDRLRRADEDDVARSWAFYARQQQLTFVAAEGEWPNRSVPRLDGGRLQIVLVREGESVVTRLELRPAESMLGHLVVTTDDSAANLPRVTLADDMLDPALAVFAKPASLVESVLTREVLRAISSFRMGGALRVEIHRGRIILEWNAAETNSARLDEARRLAEKIASSLRASFVRG